MPDEKPFTIDEALRILNQDIKADEASLRQQTTSVNAKKLLYAAGQSIKSAGADLKTREAGAVEFQKRESILKANITQLETQEVALQAKVNSAAAELSALDKEIEIRRTKLSAIEGMIAERAKDLSAIITSEIAGKGA